MKLLEVEIYDYKSIKTEKLKIISNQLCFVGKNECGKSNIIQAISYLNIFDYELTKSLLNKSSKFYPNGFPIIVGIFEISETTYLKLHKLLAKELDMIALAEIPIHSKNSFLQVKRWGNGISNISVTMTDKEHYAFDISESVKNKAKFFNDFFESVYPNIEYYEKEELLIEPASVEQLLSNDRKFETFRRLLYIAGCNDLEVLNTTDYNLFSTYISQLEDKFNAILKKHYKQDKSINVRIQTARDNKLNLIIKDESKLSFTIDERSPGFRYYFSFLINKLYSKTKNGNKKTVLLLDEPGEHLHPRGSKDLLISFNEIAENSQILYTTHNPFLTIRNCIDSLIFVTKSPKDGTKINQKPYLKKYQILRKELGILLNDSFLLGDINLIVEGNTEKLAFHRLFQFEKYKELEWLNIYNADGVTNVSQSLNYLGKNNLDLAGIVILDSDEEASNEKKKKGFLNSIKSNKWSSLEVNNVFNNSNERTFEDLIPQKLYIDAFNKYCKPLKEIGVFDKNYTDYEYKTPEKTPIIKQLENHFFSFIDDERRKQNSITKQDVIRIVLDDIENLDTKEKSAALLNCFKLLDKILIELKKIEKYVTD